MPPLFQQHASQEAVSEHTAIEQAREVWERGYREATAAGREIPVVDVPADLGEGARYSVEATQGLTRLGNRRSYTVSVDLRAMEAARLERERRAQLTANAAAARLHAQRPRKPRKRKGTGKHS